jgi:hypothetical protein
MEDFHLDHPTVTQRFDLLSASTTCTTMLGLDMNTKPTIVTTSTTSPREKSSPFIRPNSTTVPRFSPRQRSVQDFLHEASSMLLHQQQQDDDASPMLLSTSTTRRVTFHDSVTTELLETVRPASQMKDHEKSRLWWGTNELQGFASLAETRIKTMIQHRPSVESGSSTTYPALLARIYEACCNAKDDDDQSVTDRLLQSDDFPALVEAFRNSKGNRGLEPQMIQRMKMSSGSSNSANGPMLALPAIPSVAIHAVLTLQSHDQIRATTKALSIGHCSERITRPSRILAQVLAHADAACVRDNNELNHHLCWKNGVPPRQRSLEDIDPRKRRGASRLALML